MTLKELEVKCRENKLIIIARKGYLRGFLNEFIS